MEIRDPVHGSIHIDDDEIPIITTPFFQRLRNIKQLGLSEYVFPGATHTRFIHSIGVMSIGDKVFNKIFKKITPSKDIKRLEKTFKLSCLLHDIGHAPLSHATESVMPLIQSLNISKRHISIDEKRSNRQANHEDYTIKTITDSSLVESLKMVERDLEVDKDCIADLVSGKTQNPEYFSIDGINYFPVLHQLVSSELDCDRMDYLLRDAYFCGVSYGRFDLDWMIDNIEACIIDNNAYLGISERAVATFDDFLLSRFHMFLQVYFHYRSVCLEQLLLKYFKGSPSEYCIPSDIEKYILHDDYYLTKIIRSSDNRYAKAIVNNKIPTKIYESSNQLQLKQLEKVQNFLGLNEIEYIRCSSTGRLSKYYNANLESNKFPIQVFRKIHNRNSPIYKDINEATDLFQKFSKAHAVNRLHCDLDQLTDSQRIDLELLLV